MVLLTGFELLADVMHSPDLATYILHPVTFRKVQMERFVSLKVCLLPKFFSCAQHRSWLNKFIIF